MAWRRRPTAARAEKSIHRGARAIEDGPALIDAGRRVLRSFAVRSGTRPAARRSVGGRPALARHVPAGAAATQRRPAGDGVRDPADAHRLPRRAGARPAAGGAAERPHGPPAPGARRRGVVRGRVAGLRGGTVGRDAGRAPLPPGPRRRGRHRRRARDRARPLRGRRRRAAVFLADARRRDRADPRPGHRRPAAGGDGLARGVRGPVRVRSRAARRGCPRPARVAGEPARAAAAGPVPSCATGGSSPTRSAAA